MKLGQLKDHWPLNRAQRSRGVAAADVHYYSGVDLDEVLGDEDVPLDDLAHSLGAQAGARFLARRKEP